MSSATKKSLFQKLLLTHGLIIHVDDLTAMSACYSPKTETPNLSFAQLHFALTEWGEILSGLHERTIFQTPEWLSFLTKTQKGEIVLAALQSEGRTLGYFAGVVVTRLGMRILGSPLPGWTTSYMGLSLIDTTQRKAAIRALIRFAFDELCCVHLEVMDRNLSEREIVELGLQHAFLYGFEVDLTQTEDHLLANMTSACRRCIRKAEKGGVIISQAEDKQFVDDYYEQLKDVFKKQCLVPTYGIDRVRELIACVHGTGRLLLLRASDPEGRCIATGIFPAMNGTMYFWGGASWSASQRFRPNEALHWYAMRYWKAKGMKKYDMGGGGEYKRKFGGHEIQAPWFRASKYPGIPFVRDLIKQLYGWRQSALAFAKG